MAQSTVPGRHACPLLRLVDAIWPKPEQKPTDKDRVAKYDAFKKDYSALADASASSATATFLFDESKAIRAEKIELIRTLEGKASSQLAIILSGLGIASIFGAKVAGVQVGTFFWISLGALTLCVMLNMAALWPVKYVVPRLDLYNDDQIIANGYKAAIQFELVDDLSSYSRELYVVSARKGLAHRLATLFFFVGVLALIGNALVQVQIPKAGSSVHNQHHGTQRSL